MTRDRKNDPALDVTGLDRFILDELFGTSDEDLVREASEDGVDLAKSREAHLALLAKATMIAGRSRQAVIRAEMARDRDRTPVVVDLDRAKASYERIVAGNDNAAARMTMAARKQDGDAGADLDGMLEDFVELGLIDGGAEDESGE